MSTGLRITQVVLLLIGVMTLYGCGSADNTDNNNNMAEQNLSSTNNISNQEDNIERMNIVEIICSQIKIVIINIQRIQE